jgi:hypothetical protein
LGATLKLILLLIFVVACSQAPLKRSDGKLSILQGITSAREVEFSIVSQKERELRFEIRSESGHTYPPIEYRKITYDFSPYAVHKLIFHHDQEKDHNIYVFEGEKLVDQRLIGKGSLNPSRLKLAVASSNQKEIWETLLRKNPEYLLLIGEEVIKKDSSDKSPPTFESVWQSYIDIRHRLPLYYQQKLIPTQALWDEDTSKEIFEAFWAQSLGEESWAPSFGVGGLLSLGDFNLYFLDARSFRSPMKEGNHLGIDQTSWLIKSLKAEEKPSILIKGDQFFGGYHSSDSYEGGHPQDFSQFISSLKGLSTPFIFLSADQSSSEIMQFPRTLFGKPSFEITTSASHTGPEAQKEDFNPWRVVALKERDNFLMIENQALNDHWFLEVQSIGQKGEVYFKRELAVYIKDLQDNLQEIRKRRQGKRRYRRGSRRR